MRESRARTAILFGFCALLCRFTAAAQKRRHAPSAPTIEDDRYYKAGISLYAAGQRQQALGSFRIALHHHPRNTLVLTAIRRVEGELGAAPPVEYASEAPSASWFDAASDSFDEFMLVDVPRAVNFEDSLGDCASDVGTLEALNGRVAQLMKERECALKHGCRFRKDREMRSLIRRMPTIVA